MSGAGSSTSSSVTIVMHEMSSTSGGVEVKSGDGIAKSSGSAA
jgi:hypothetical protein